MKKSVLFFTAAILFLLSLNGYAQFTSPFTVEGKLDQSTDPAVVVVSATIPENHYLYVKEFKVMDGADNPLAAIDHPETIEIDDLFSESKKKAYSKAFTAKYKWEPSSEGQHAIHIEYLGCNDQTCFMPQRMVIELSEETNKPEESEIKLIKLNDPADTEWGAELENFKVLGSSVGYMSAGPFLEFLEETKNGEKRSVSGFRLFLSDPVAFVQESGVILTVIFILLGGLALNLTPCVLPMIPINLAIIGAGAQASSKKRGFALGATYGAGIALVYGLVGLIVVLTGSNFGTIQSSPWFNLVIAILFFVLALAMFDLFHIDFSRFQSKVGGEQQKQGSYLLALTMGSVAALLAGACVAPVVIAVLLLATGLGTFGLLLPFVLGLGMALPWPFAGAGLSFLPKPGKWMEYVKYAFGIGIVLFALYYATLSYRGFRPANVTTGSEGHLVIDGATNEGFANVLQQAREEGKPVFIDFWASWCKNCLATDKNTFKNSEVKKALDDYLFIKYVAEDFDAPNVKQVMSYFGVQGLPTFVVLKPVTAE